MNIFEKDPKKDDVPLSEYTPEVTPALQIHEKEVVNKVPLPVINGALEELIRNEEEMDRSSDIKRPPTIN